MSRMSQFLHGRDRQVETVLRSLERDAKTDPPEKGHPEIYAILKGRATHRGFHNRT